MAASGLVQAVFTREDGSQVLVDIWTETVTAGDPTGPGTLVRRITAASMAEREQYGSWGPPVEGKLS